MKVRSKFYLCQVFLLILIICQVDLFAQVSRSAYFLQHLTVSNIINPSFAPSGEFYISLPVISSTYVGFDGLVNYSELTEKSKTDDYIYIDRQTFLDKLDNLNVLSLNLYSTLGQVGYRYNQHAFQVSMAKIWSTNIFLEKDFVNFLLSGNANKDFIGRDLNFSKTGINSTLYHEFAFGYTYDLNSKFSFGIKLKYLNGEANIYTEKATLNFYTKDNANYEVRASSDIAVHTSSDYGYLENIGDQDITQYMWLDFSKNNGFAVDLGAKYNPNPDLQISASVLDLGKIKWKENVRSYVSKNPGKEFLFEGIDINDFINDNNISDSVPLLDSLSNHFEIEKINTPYSSPLTPKTYIGVTYNVTENDQFGMLLKTEYYKYCSRTSYTLNYKRKLGKIAYAMVNYTFLHKSSYFGAGFSIQAGIVRIYALSDMVPSFISPLNARSANFQFGISFVFDNP